MKDKPSPIASTLSFGIRHIHLMDWWVAHKILYPLFRWVTTYTAFEQWHVVRFLLFLVPFAAFAFSPLFGLMWLFSLVKEYFVYFVKLPKEYKRSDIKATMAADSRHSIQPSHFTTGVLLILMLFNFTSMYTYTIKLIAPDLFGGSPNGVGYPAVLPWALYHITQWLDFPPKKSLKEEVSKHLLLKKQRETVRVVA